MTVLEWIWCPSKGRRNISICWKVVLQAYDLIRTGLSWKAGDGTTVWVGKVLGLDVHGNIIILFTL